MNSIWRLLGTGDLRIARCSTITATRRPPRAHVRHLKAERKLRHERDCLRVSIGGGVRTALTGFFHFDLMGVYEPKLSITRKLRLLWLLETLKHPLRMDGIPLAAYTNPRSSAVPLTKAIGDGPKGERPSGLDAPPVVQSARR